MANPVNHVGKAADDDNNHMGAEPSGRWRRLKDATEQTHDRLDHRIMAPQPLSPTAGPPPLSADLASRRRLGAIVQDLADLGLTPTGQHTPTPFATEVDI